MGPGKRRGVVALLAGGSGARVGAALPKQLLEVGGRTLLEHGLRTFHAHARVDDIVVVMAREHLAAARSLVSAGGYGDKVRSVVPGGATRADSTLAALAAIEPAECDLLVHDAARPLVTARILDDCFAALSEHAVVNVAVAASDTIVAVDADGLVTGTPPRESLQHVQTPQGFHSEVLRAAYARAADDPAFAATDDCGVVRRYLPEQPIVVVPGDQRNLKVTTRLDLLVVEALLSDGG